MDYKKIKTETTAVTRQKDNFYDHTGNIYEPVVVLSKRANQIGLEIKQELDQKIEEFAPATDNLEEVFENREQIEIARLYENHTVPALFAINEYLNGDIYMRNPHKGEGGF